MSSAENCPFCGASFEALPGQSSTCPSCHGVFVPSGSSEVPREMPPPMAASGPGNGEKACPMCGEIIRAAALICRYCKAQLGHGMPSSPSPGYSPPQNLDPSFPKKKSRWLMWTLIAGGIVLLCCGFGAAGLFISGGKIVDEGCRQNMGQLANQMRLLAQNPDTLSEMDEKRGTDFWRYVARELNEENKEICIATILLQFEPRAYRGPKKPYSDYADEDPIGACPMDAHEDGAFVIYKNGSYEFVPESDKRFNGIFEMLTD